MALADKDTSGMSPYRKAEVEMAQAACAVLTWYHDAESISSDLDELMLKLEEKLDAWSEVQPR